MDGNLSSEVLLDSEVQHSRSLLSAAAEPVVQQRRLLRRRPPPANLRTHAEPDSTTTTLPTKATDPSSVLGKGNHHRVLRPEASLREPPLRLPLGIVHHHIHLSPQPRWLKNVAKACERPEVATKRPEALP